jgi:hypothetical protein
MHELERMVAVLVRNIEHRSPMHLSQPFRVADVFDVFIPYRTYRAQLGLETNDDYEMALTQLLAGAGNYLDTAEDVRAAMRAELESPNPDTSRYRKFAASEVSLLRGALAARHRVDIATPRPAEPNLQIIRTGSPVQLESVGGGETVRSVRQPQKSSVAPAVSKPPVPAAVQPAMREERNMPPVQETTPASGTAGKCRYCQGALPASRSITYCPHCGQDLTVHHCPACSSELEVGWKFCVTCGRSVEE